MNPIERFRSSTRQVHIWMFTVLSMFLSTITGVLLLIHIISRFNILYVLGYSILLISSTIITIGIPMKDASLPIKSIFSLIRNQQTNFKVFTILYFIFALLLGLVYTPIHIWGVQLLSSPFTSLVGSLFLISLGLQFIVLNYLTVGTTQMTREEIEQLQNMMEDKIDEYDPEEYKNRDIEPPEEYDIDDSQNRSE